MHLVGLICQIAWFQLQCTYFFVSFVNFSGDLHVGFFVTILNGITYQENLTFDACVFAIFKMFFTELLSYNPYPTAFPYENGMVLHFYQQQESSTTKTVHKVINKGLKTYV